MIFKKLGKTNLMVSQIALGGIEISRIERKNAVYLVREAIDLGINLIDTAHAYSYSEEIIGEAIKKKRDTVFLSTKSMNTSKKLFRADLESSFRNLKTDYLDIFLFHDCSLERFNDLSANGIFELVIEENEKGKIGHIGFSCHSRDVIEKYYQISKFSVLMIPINFVTSEFTEDKIYKRAISENIGILAMKPLGGGRIMDVELCFKYLSQFKEAIPVVGVESIEELRQDLKYIEKPGKTTEKDILKMSKIAEGLGNNYCRDCRYCMPCPAGINIPVINFVKTNYRRLSKTIVFSDEYIREVKKSSECKECRTCESKCPFKLNIVDILKENRDFYMKKLQKNILTE
ncbi:MAG: aldo/keto reductase [Actinobacteria bacterium]|nr:aldo/keto reductase [Actinomycetota bacterium]MCL5070767.1 aldo/keto reductase [Actinomycetota bacterium]